MQRNCENYIAIAITFPFRSGMRWKLIPGTGENLITVHDANGWVRYLSFA